MMHKQRGVTMIGWIFLLIPMAIVIYAGIRVGPEYLNYYKVSQALKESASSLKGDDAVSVLAIRTAIAKRFDTGYIEKPSPEDIVIAKDEDGWAMNADYESTVPLFGNMYLLMTFKQTVKIN